MINIQEVMDEALAEGFSQVGELNCEALEFMPEIREMCAANRCQSYCKNWTCPPACGSLEQSVEKASQYTKGIIVQTIGKMEDDFDYDTISATMNIHRDNVDRFAQKLRKQYPDVLPMGAGACAICETCSYPDAPCRFPDRAITSMEAYGLFVSKVCTLSGVPYNNGPQTITYTSCYLLDKK